MQTEAQNPRSMKIDEYSTLEMLQVMNEEDARVALAVRDALPEIAKAVEAIADNFRRGGRLIYVGAGTSGRLGVLDAVECVPTFSTNPSMVVGLIAGGEKALTTAVEGAEDSPEQGRQDLLDLRVSEVDTVVGIAASGRTPYVLGGIEVANDIGAMTVGVACNVPCALLDLAQIKIGVPVGAEIVTGSTRLKAGTAQKMVLNMLSTGSMVQLGKVYGNLMVDVKVTNAKLQDRAERIVMQVAGVDQERAGDLLSKAENEVKTAIVMGVRGVAVDEARELLKAAEGRLREVIGDRGQGVD